jgi:oligoendopeptidase F
MSYSQTRWKLDALLPSAEGPEVEKALKAFERKVKKVEGWRAKLKPSMPLKAFLTLLKDYEAMQKEIIRLNAFAQLRFAADTQDQAVLAFLGQMQQRLALAQNRTLFFTLWWRKLDHANAKRLMKSSGDLRYWLEEMRHFKPYTLSEPEEKIINLKDVNGVRALETLYDAITNKFTFTIEVNGEKKTLTEDALVVYVQHPDPALREAAYKERLRVYTEQNLVLSQIYSSIVRDWRSENMDLRKFKSPISVRNLANDVPDEVVNTLLRVIEKNAPVFQRYFKLKAKWIGSPTGKLRRYDLYAPLAGAEKEYAYDTAVSMVLDTFTEFAPEVGTLARQVFDDGHVDAEVRHGKQSGAFCASAFPGVSPWVLLNYNGRAYDVTVMAHEMGHAIHSLLARRHSLLTFHSSLPMAETASVFAEMLLTEKLLAQETDLAVRRDLLARLIDRTYASVGRQGFFAIWEKEAHELVQQGRTADEMAARYLENLKAQFGDALDISDDFRWEWILISHFYSVPFYVYAYAFGQLLVLALYQMFKREGEAFKPKYLKILSYGGSEAPMRILKEAGIDIASAKFWQGGFDVIAGMIDELERLEG